MKTKPSLLLCFAWLVFAFLTAPCLAHHHGEVSVIARTLSGTLLTNQYGFDSYGRLSSVGNGGVYSSTYAYLANSDLLQRTTNVNGSTPLLTTTRQWDSGYRLRSISSAAGSSVVSSHSYLYDDLDRRTHAYLEDGSLWLYGYNDRDELIRGQRYWSDWSPVTGQRFEYAYDAIGNRVTAASGGDTAGGNLRTSSYTPNQLNQYTTVVTPGFKDVSGAAWATSTVTVNGGATDRKGEYWHRELGVSNGSSPVWQSVTATTGTTSSNGGFVLPRSSQSITHDLDGNLSFDGVWSYQWTAENRLASMAMTNVSGIANSNRLKLDFVYDHEGRRAGKIVSAWKAAIIDFAREYPLEGYRRLAFMMLDQDVVAVSPSSVYRVLKSAGLLQSWQKPTRKGSGFTQPLAPHEHWHIDFSYVNIGGTFYYLCSILDGCSRYIVQWDIREAMKGADAEIVLQKAREQYPDARPRMISDNGPQFVAKDFKEFIRLWQTSHVFTSPHYPQSNGKLERWHRTLKEQAVRPKTPLTLEDARRIVAEFVEHYNNVRLHSAIGYIAPKDKLEGRAEVIWEARDQKLEAAREKRRQKRAQDAPLPNEEACQ